MFPLSIISSTIYLINNSINVFVCSSVAAGVLIGGLLGALFLKKLNSTIVRWVFICVLFFAGVRMVV